MRSSEAFEGQQTQTLKISLFYSTQRQLEVSSLGSYLQVMIRCLRGTCLQMKFYFHVKYFPPLFSPKLLVKIRRKMLLKHPIFEMLLGFTRVENLWRAQLCLPEIHLRLRFNQGSSLHLIQDYSDCMF